RLRFGLRLWLGFGFLGFGRVIGSLRPCGGRRRTVGRELHLDWVRNGGRCNQPEQHEGQSGGMRGDGIRPRRTLILLLGSAVHRLAIVILRLLHYVAYWTWRAAGCPRPLSSFTAGRSTSGLPAVRASICRCCATDP